jgi:hypothetical protein
MKEFDRWWKDFGQYEFSTYLTKNQSKTVWKAALEWAKTHEIICDETDGFAVVFDIGILAIPSNIINKELDGQASNKNS